MKNAFPWLIAGLAIGAAAVIILSAPETEPSYTDPDVEHAANKVNAWGAKQRVTGTGGSVLGTAKQKIGEVTGNDDLAGEGVGDQALGHIKDAAGKAAGVVGDALHELNRND